MSWLRRCGVTLLVTLSVRTAGVRAADGPGQTDAAGRRLFDDHVRGILTDRCVKCHGGEKIKGEFDLTTRGGLLHPGDEGPNVVPGSAKTSRLYQLITHAQDPHMPAKADRLPDEAIAKIAAWIDAGAPYTEPLVKKSTAAKGHAVVTEEDRQYWAFVPLKRAELPAVKNGGWVRTPVDRFILAALERKGIAPNSEATKRKLIRRAYFDLIGLPPTPEEVAAFVDDASPNAWEKIVDRLLASPHYGERWARHWLDLARFAESHGYEQDYDRPHAYPYRDFVINALNRDLPYDRFVRWQLAGDEFAPGDEQALAATGFLAAGTHATQITANQAEKERYDELDDMAAVTTTTFLGLTVGCARCHDHKFDPIPTKDYYRLISTFTTTVRGTVVYDETTHAVRPQPTTKPGGRYPATQPNTPYLMVCSEGIPAIRLHTQGPDFYPQTYFCKRGDVNQKDGEIAAGFLTVLMRHPDGEKHWQETPPADSKTSYRRRSLANWITDVEYGAGHLLARVMVNRLWQHHFGRGLVSTPNDFGVQGEKPTHPELLDYLATELIRGGWRLKPIHRLLMLSSVYCESGQYDDTRAAVDVDDLLCWRRGHRRLEAEVIRDSMLAVAGELDPTMFGPGSLKEDMDRRSIYFVTKRSQLVPILMLFDAPNSLAPLPDRAATVIAPQALALMNHPQVIEYAKAFAARLKPAMAVSSTDAVRRAYAIALAREPSTDELADATVFLTRQADSYRSAGKTAAADLALSDFCQSLMSVNEFVYVE